MVRLLLRLDPNTALQSLFYLGQEDPQTLVDRIQYASAVLLSPLGPTLCIPLAFSLPLGLASEDAWRLAAPATVEGRPSPAAWWEPTRASRFEPLLRSTSLSSSVAQGLRGG